MNLIIVWAYGPCTEASGPPLGLVKVHSQGAVCTLHSFKSVREVPLPDTVVQAQRSGGGGGGGAGNLFEFEVSQLVSA